MPWPELLQAALGTTAAGLGVVAIAAAEAF